MARVETAMLPARRNTAGTRACCPYHYNHYSKGDWRVEWCPGWVAYIVPPEYAGGVSVLATRVGWTQDDDGLVHEHKYNEERRKRGLRDKDRRPPPYALSSPAEGRIINSFGILYPARARCTCCKREMVLDPDVLRVVAPLD